MPAWPTDTITTTSLSSGTGLAKDARAELLAVAQAVKGMLASSPLLSSGSNHLGLTVPVGAEWGSGIDVWLLNDDELMAPPNPFILFYHRAALFSMGNGIAGLALNAYHDGTAWRVYDSIFGMAVIFVDAAGTIRFKYNPDVTNDVNNDVIVWQNDTDISGARGASKYMLSTDSVTLAYPAAWSSAQPYVVNFSGTNYDSDNLVFGAGAFIVRAGIRQIRLSYALRFSAYNDQSRACKATIWKNQAPLTKSSPQGGVFAQQVGAHAFIVGNANGTSGIIDVAENDVFEIRIDIDADTTLGQMRIESDGSFCALEIIS